MLEIGMGSSLKQIEEQALGLKAEERAKLAEVMLESLNAPIAEVEAAWAREIEQRVAAYDRGDTQSHPAEDVFAEAKRIGK
jgi:putative addiction module component (TIGR02574 family)